MNRITIFFLLLLLSFFSCEKVDNTLSGSLQGIPEVSGSTTSYSEVCRVYDAIGYGGGVLVSYSEIVDSRNKVAVLNHTGSRDSENYPRLVFHGGKVIYSTNLFCLSYSGSYFTIWGPRVFVFMATNIERNTMGVIDKFHYTEISEVNCDISSGSCSVRPIGPIEVNFPLTVKRNMEGKVNTSRIQATEFCGRIYAVIKVHETGELALIRTTQEGATGSPSWEFVSWVNLNGNVLNETEFDLTTALVEQADDSFVEELYLGLNHGNGNISICRYNYTDEWINYQHNIGVNIGNGSFRMEKGEIKNSGQDNTKLAIQAIASKGSDVVSTSFYPSTKTFGSSVRLKNHNGSMVVASSTTPIMGNTSSDIPSSYQQHLYVIQAEDKIGEKMDIDRYTSNLIKCNTTGSALVSGEAAIEKYLADPDTRQLCALVAIVEGPPPTFVNLQSDFDALLPTVPTTLRLSKSESSENTQDYSYTLGVSGEVEFSNIDTRKLSAFKGMSVSLGLDISGTEMATTTRKKSVKLNRIFNSTITASKYASLLYSIPKYSLHEYYYYSSDGKIRLLNGPISSYVDNDDVIIYSKSIPINEPPFNIADPSILSNWSNRFRSTVTDGSQKSLSLAYNFDIGSNTISKSFEKSTEEGRGKVSRQQVKLSAEMVTKVVAVSGSVYGDFTQSQSYSSNLSNEMDMTYYQMDASVIKGNYGISSYTSSLFLMYENCENAQRYYEKLLSDKLMLPDENPWILGYQVSDIATK